MSSALSVLATRRAAAGRVPTDLERGVGGGTAVSGAAAPASSLSSTLSSSSTPSSLSTTPFAASPSGTASASPTAASSASSSPLRLSVSQCVCLLMVVALLSLAPLAAYFGIFRGSSTSVASFNGGGGGAGGGGGGVAYDVADTSDHAVRSRLWLKYVGRAPLQPEKLVMPSTSMPPAVHVLPQRERFEKAGGWFIQHPQDTNVWLEFEDKSSIVYSWKLKESTTLGDMRQLTFDDYSMPKRANSMLRLLLPSNNNGYGATFAHGAKADAAAVDVVWQSPLPLYCRGAGCSVPAAPESSKPRIVYKSNGGVFLERAGGAVWSESNVDGGALLFHWGVVRERDDEILLQDAGRGMWLRIKPAPPRDGSTMQRGTVLLATGAAPRMGRDNEPVDEAHGDYSPWSLLSNACDPQRTCKTALKRIDAERKARGEGPPLHIVFSVTAMEKYEWESKFFLYWYNVSQTLSKRGSVTRLLTATRPDHLMNEIPTFVASPPPEMITDHYVPYNKITSILQWIRAMHDKLPADAIVCIMDVDVVLLEDISFLAVGVERGKPRGAKGFMSFADDDSPYDRMIKRYCKGCTGADPLAVPYFIHKTDLLQLAPRWLDKCRELRQDTQPFHLVKDWRAFKPLQLGWTAEQWAYLLAAAELGLRHDVREDMSAFTGCGVLQIDEPMIHFSDWTKGIKNGAEFKWSKGMSDALAQIPDHDPKNPCEIDRAMLAALKDARDHVKLSGHKWPNPHQPEF